MSRKAEFYALIEPLLKGQKEVKRDTIELAQDLQDVLNNINIDVNGESFGDLKEAFNEKLSELGKQPIVFSENTLKGVINQFADAVSAGIKAGVAEGSNAIKSLLKDKAALEEAYNKRQANGRGSKTKVKQKLGERANEAIHYRPAETARTAGSHLRSIKQEYEKAAGWESQYIALLKYVKEYEALEKLTKNPKVLDNWKEIGGYHIDQLKQQIPAIQHSLQNIFNLAHNMHPTGLTPDGAIDVNVQLNLLDTIDTYDVTGGKGYIEVEAKPKIKEFTAYRVVEETEDGAERKQEVIEAVGAEYWAKESHIAKSYSSMHDPGSSYMIQGKIRPVNPLILDADGAAWNEFHKISDFSKIFPGLSDFIKSITNKQGKFEAVDVQKYLAEQAKSAGFDAIILENVRDAANEEQLKDKEYYEGTTIAVLDDSIVELSKAFKSTGNVIDKFNTQEFSKKSEKIPDFYQGSTELTPAQRLTALQQQQAQSDAWYTSEISRLKENEKANADTIEVLEGLRTSAQKNFEKEIDYYTRLSTGEAPQVSRQYELDNERVAKEQRRKELVNILDIYGKDVLDSQTADNSIAKRKAIFELLQKEGLLTDEIKKNYDEVNQRLEARADLIREAESHYDDPDDILTGQRVTSVDSADQFRKDHIQPFDNVIAKMHDSGFFSEEELENSFEAISRSMEQRARNIAAKDVFTELDKNIIDPNTINDAEQLNRILAERNTILNSVDEMSLIDYDHNAYADALKHNQLIEDRIAMLQKASSLENLYNNAPESVKKIVDEMVVLEHQMHTLKERTAGTTLKGFFKFDPSDEHKVYILNTFEEYKRVVKEISEYPIVDTKDDKKRLIELKEEAARLGATLQQAYMSDSDANAFVKAYGLSYDDAIELRRISGSDAGRTWYNDIYESIRQDYDKLYDALDAADKNFLTTIINTTSQWDELSQAIISRVNAETVAHSENAGDANSAEIDSLRQQLEEANRRAEEAETRARDERNKRTIAEESFSDLHDDLYDAQKQARAAEEEAARLRDELAKKSSGASGGTGDTDTGAEATRMTSLKEAVEAVTNAVGLKTSAFQTEKTEVDKVVNAEIESLGRLESKITTIKGIFEGLVNNIRGGSDDIGAGLNNVNITVNYPENSQTILDQEALNKLADIIKQAQTKTPETAIDAAGKALATESTLSAIKAAVESIDGKTIKGAKVGSDRKSTTADDYKGSPFFGEKLKTREMELAKFVQKLMNDGQDTAKMQDVVKQLRDALKFVDSGEKLSVWDQKFRQAKLAVGIDELKEKPDEQESVQTYKNLIAYAKEYYSIVEKHEKAKEGTRRKAILAQQKQDAEAFMRDGGLDIDTLELGDAAYNKKLSDLRARHKLNLEVISADKSDTTNSQQIKKESDALETLLDLYKEYGKLDAKWNYSDGKNEAAEQERQMLDIYKKIQEQKVSMGIAGDDTKYDAQITKAWEEGFKDIENAKREARSKASDKSEVKRIQDEVKSVEKYVKELGSLEAELQFASGKREISEINRQMEQKKKYIDLKKQELQLDEKSLLIQQTKSYQDKYNSLSLKDRRTKDKDDATAITKRNNEAYERLIKLKREQYDIEKKLFNVEKGSKLETTYQSQLTAIKNLIANQKTLVHYNAKYERQLTDMANAHQRNKVQWESGKIDDARADALAAEKKEVDKLAGAYKTLGKLIAERNYATLPEEKDAIQAIINKHVKDINANQYNTANRFDMLRGVAREAQIAAEEGLSRKAAKKTGTDRLRSEAKAENEDLAKQKQIISNLISLYKQLGQAKARQNKGLFSEEQVAQAYVEDAQLRRLIKAERAKLSSVDLDTDMRFKGAKAEGYRLATTNAERAAAGKATSQRMREETKAENDALQEQKQTVADLITLYKQLGQAEAKRDMTSRNGSEARIADKEVQSINDQIDAKRKLIKVDNELESQFADSWMSGIESETKKPVKDLGKEYEKLGKIRAEVDKTPDGEYLAFLKKQLATQQKLVEVESRRLGISDDLRDSYNQMADSAYNDKAAELERKAAKERDKARNKDQADLFKKQIQQSKELAKVGKTRSAIDKADNLLASATSIGGWTSEQTAKLNDYSNALKKLKDQYIEIKYSDGAVTPQQQQELVTQTANVNKLTDEIGELVAEYNRLSGANATELGAMNLGDTASIDEYRKKLTEMVMEHTKGKATITGFNAATKELSYTVDTGKYEFTEYTAAARHLDNMFVTLQGNTKKLETPLEKLKRKMSEILTYFGGSSLIYEAFAQVRQGIQYVREIDLGLTELKKVTDETEEAYERFLDTASKTGARIGSTSSDFTQATATFAKLGYDIDIASEMAEAAIVYKNVGDGIESADEAADSIISTMKGFGLEASDSMAIVDRFNEVGKFYCP